MALDFKNKHLYCNEITYYWSLTIRLCPAEAISFHNSRWEDSSCQCLNLFDNKPNNWPVSCRLPLDAPEWHRVCWVTSLHRHKMYRRSWTSLVRKEPVTVIPTLHHSLALSDESYKPFPRKVHMHKIVHSISGDSDPREGTAVSSRLRTMLWGRSTETFPNCML